MTAKRNLFLLIISVIFSYNVFAQVTTETQQFFSHSLNQNRSALVIKPESCTAESPYPVLVFLPGWGMLISHFSFFSDVLSDLIISGKIEPMLIVVPDESGGIYGRTMWWNSVVNGNFSDYIAKDITDWIAQEYPILKNSQNIILTRDMG